MEPKLYIPWRYNPWRVTGTGILFFLVGSLRVYYSYLNHEKTGFYAMIVIGSGLIVYAWTFHKKWKIRRGVDNLRHEKRLPNLLFIAGDLFLWSSFLIGGAIKYFVPGLIDTAIVLLIIGLCFYFTGQIVVGFNSPKDTSGEYSPGMPFAFWQFALALAITIAAIILKIYDWQYADIFIIGAIAFILFVLRQYIFHRGRKLKL